MRDIQSSSHTLHVNINRKKGTMQKRALELPFVTKTPNNESLSYPAELALVICLAESQRKKPIFLRETQERIGSISKLHYPLWVMPVENACLIIDGLKTSAREFTFEEPETAVLVEELKRNSGNPQKFIETLKAQGKETKTFTSPITVSFAAVVDDKELLGFFPEYLRSGTFQDQQEIESIPAETNARAAEETTRAFANCLRTIEADAKGIRYALAVLKEELDFYTNAVKNESEGLQEKFDVETEALKPIVEKVVQKLTTKHDKEIASFQKNLERKLAALDKRREKYMRKLQVAEQRKDRVKQRRDAAKKKKNSFKVVFRIIRAKKV